MPLIGLLGHGTVQIGPARPSKIFTQSLTGGIRQVRRISGLRSRTAARYPLG
jgi:hypothetical protein